MAKPSASKKGKSVPVPVKKPSVVVTKPQTQKQELQTVDEDFARMMEADSGLGTSSDMSDNIVPLIYILQSLSPQALEQKAEYIEGAKAGKIWFRGTKDLIDGKKGILVQPVFFSKAWIEWQPNRGGFVARHNERPEDAVQEKDDKNPKKIIWRMPSGNTVSESREHVVLVHFDDGTYAPFVIPMSGSQHASSRGWMTSMNRKITPKGLKAPSFAYLYRMKTIPKTNDQGDWYGWDIADAGEGNTPLMVSDMDAYVMARNICTSFQKGELRAADGADETDDAAQDDNSEI